MSATTVGAGPGAHFATRSTLQIYRDLMRLAGHVGMVNHNEPVLRAIIRKQFKSNKLEQDPVKIEQYRQDAVRAITTYMVHSAQEMLKNSPDGKRIAERQKRAQEEHRRQQPPQKPTNPLDQKEM